MSVDASVSPPTRRPVTNALEELLRSVTGRPIGVVNVPASESGEQNPVCPYAIIYPVPGGYFDGPFFATPDVDAEYVFQVTSVGETYDQCEWMADRVRAAILGRSSDRSFTYDLVLLDPEGDPDTRIVNDRRPESGPGDVGRSQEGPIGLYNSVERFRICTTPA